MPFLSFLAPVSHRLSLRAARGPKRGTKVAAGLGFGGLHGAGVGELISVSWVFGSRWPHTSGTCRIFRW